MTKVDVDKLCTDCCAFVQFGTKYRVLCRHCKIPHPNPCLINGSRLKKLVCYSLLIHTQFAVKADCHTFLLN